METFWSTALRYAKGDSGLPSVLPARGSGEKSRRVRLFCKGLEHFREILYAEPAVDDISGTEVAAFANRKQDQEHASSDEAIMLTSADQKHQAITGTAADWKNEAITGAKADQKNEAITETTANQKHEAITGMVADQKYRKYKLAPVEDLFQSLFNTEKTPPTSPGNASSSSTLVDPSSRRVSPSDATVGAEATSTTVADVADPSLDGSDISDPVSSLDKMPKLELLRQLEEMTAEEERACRKAEKHAARSKQLSAEIAALKGQLRDIEVQDDVAKTHGAALTLLNFVRGHAMQDDVHRLRREQHGRLVQAPDYVMETTCKQDDVHELGLEQDGGLAQGPDYVGETIGEQDDVHELGGEQHGRFAQGPDCVVETTCKQDDVHELGDQAQETECVRDECVGETPGEKHDVHERGLEQDGGLAQGTECVGAMTGEQGKEGSVQKLGEFTKFLGASAYGALQRLEYSSDGSDGELDDGHDQKYIQKEDESTIHETVEMQGVASTAVEFSDWQKQSDPQAYATKSKGIDSASREVQLIANAEAAEGIPKEKIELAVLTIEESIGEKDSDAVSCMPGALCEGTTSGVSDSSDNSGESITQDDGHRNLNTSRGSRASKTEEINDSESNSEEIPPTPKHNHNENTLSAHTMAPSDVIIPEIVGTCIRNESPINSNYEFPEAAGAATLWGILQSSHCEDTTEERADAKEAASSSDAKGPATLWGILRSDHSENESKEREAGEDVANSSEVSDYPGDTVAGYRVVREWEITEALQATADVALKERETGPPNTPDNERDQDGPKGVNDHSDKSNGPKASVLLSADSCENGDTKSNDSDAIARALSTTRYSSSGALLPFQTEKFDLIPAMIKPPELTKTQKRKLEKKRAALKKREAAELERRRGDSNIG